MLLGCITMLEHVELPKVSLLDYFFIPKTRAFAALATRNLTTVLAEILIFCCVLGLNPGRAFKNITNHV
jgi:hypothetical protein